MKRLPTLTKTLLLQSLLALFCVRVDAQPQRSTEPDGELFRTIASLDGAVFDAFNRCDLEKFGAFFTDDLEFYHDQGGLTRSRQSVVEQVKSNICGKVTRELVPGTLEVYPMKGYGAVEIGVHRFHHPGRESTEPVGEAKFIHLWQNKDGAWKITRVISYDHHALEK
jgi:ketosteroid isomerase-like protein